MPKTTQPLRATISQLTSNNTMKVFDYSVGYLVKASFIDAATNTLVTDQFIAVPTNRSANHIKLMYYCPFRSLVLTESVIVSSEEELNQQPLNFPRNTIIITKTQATFLINKVSTNDIDSTCSVEPQKGATAVAESGTVIEQSPEIDSNSPYATCNNEYTCFSSVELSPVSTPLIQYTSEKGRKNYGQLVTVWKRQRKSERNPKPSLTATKMIMNFRFYRITSTKIATDIEPFTSATFWINNWVESAIFNNPNSPICELFNPNYKQLLEERNTVAANQIAEAA